MGFFDWLKGTPESLQVADDSIWLTKQAKLAGIKSAVTRSLAAQSKPAAVLLVAHFQDCLNDLKEVVKAGGFSSELVVAVLAQDLKGSAAIASDFDASAIIEIVVAEKHPLPSHNESVSEFARSLPCRSRLTFHVSLEDAFMRTFAGEWVQGVLKQLGMKEDETIKSDMVARRIKAAQQKIESRSVSDLAANSSEEWMSRNCPELWRQVSS